MLGLQIFEVPKLWSSVWLNFVDLFSVGWPRTAPGHEHPYPPASPRVILPPTRCCGAEHRRDFSENKRPDSGPAHPWSRAGQAKLHLMEKKKRSEFGFVFSRLKGLPATSNEENGCC